jgi:hypothetical protein
VHLDRPFDVVPPRDVPEAIEVEVAPEFPVDAGEQVEVEPRRDPFALSS